jgi:hypothetical protein
MQDTVILYDISAGIELRNRGSRHQSQDRQPIAEECKFRVDAGSRFQRDREEFAISGKPSAKRLDLIWVEIEAALHRSPMTNSKVVVIGSGKDGLPVILGNADVSAPPPAGSTPSGSGSAKERTTAPSPTVPLEKTPAAGLAPPAENMPPANSSTWSAAAHEGPRSFWPLSLSDIETYVSRTVRSEPKD